MLASLATTGRGGAAAGAGGARGMRELEHDAAITWPAWCYSAAESGVVRGEPPRATTASRLCPREPASAPQPSPPQPPPVKSERLSPHQNDNNSSVSRSGSVTPSSSYPGTPPERASPAAPARNYSDIMRSLAARYNQPTHTESFYHPARNGFPSLDARLGKPPLPVTSPLPTPLTSSLPTGLTSSLPALRTSPPQDGDQLVGGMFAGFPSGNLQQRVPAFPVMMDMSSTKTLLALAKIARGSAPLTARRDRRRPKRACAGAPEHSPLDLSAGAEVAKRARRGSASSGSHASSPRAPSPRESDERRSDTESRDERTESGVRECGCAGSGCERLAAWGVDDVYEFVQSIDICAEYAPNFREHRIDGAGLPLLTEEHLTGSLRMKLGPALKLQATLRKRLRECATCTPRVNGASVKSEPNSHTSSPS